MNFSEAYQYTIQSIISIYGKDESKAIAQFLFKEKYHATFLFMNNEPFPFESELQLIVARLIQHEPVQYILGYTYFNDLRISVNKNVLIPRAETEELVELVKPFITPDVKIIADICTGSGCIALSIFSAFKDKRIIATDISELALEIASINEKINFKENNILFGKHDILTQQWPFEMPDIITCNPPYIARGEAESMDDHVLQHEPHLALFVEDNDALLFYKTIVKTFLPFTFPKIFFEINPLFSSKISTYCHLNSLQCEIRKDMQGKERFAIISQL